MYLVALRPPVGEASTSSPTTCSASRARSTSPVYRNEKQDRDFELASRIEFDTPVAGVLENIHGLCAKVLLLGCVRVRSMVRDGDTVEVRVGTFTSESPLTPIKTRGPARPRTE